MLGRIFYHSTMRRYAIMFGNMFNDVVVRRFDSDSNTLQSINVPITFAPRQKWVSLLHEDPQKPVATQYPRMGFEIGTSWAYDGSRKQDPTANIVKIADDKTEMVSTFNCVPWKIGAELNVAAKNTDDLLQIIEQVIVFFNPGFTNSVNLIPSLDRKWDIVTRLDSLNYDQGSFEGDYANRQFIVARFEFTIDVWFFMPLVRQGPIKRVQVDLISVPGSGVITNAEVAQHGRAERVVTLPGLDSEGKPIPRYENITILKDGTIATETVVDPNLSIPYTDIGPEDDYGFMESYYTFDDGLKYNPRTGNDE